jgi:hypothetical protein
MHHRYEVTNSGQKATLPSEMMKDLRETTNRTVTESRMDSERRTEFQLIICGAVINPEKIIINTKRVPPLNWELICVNMVIAATNEIKNWKKTFATSDAKIR